MSYFGALFKIFITSLTPVFHTGNLVIDPVWGNHPSVQPREVKVYPEGEPNSNMFQCAVKFLVLPPDVLPVVFFFERLGWAPLGLGQVQNSRKTTGVLVSKPDRKIEEICLAVPSV